MEIPRYLPDRPFPPYAYLPGRDAHPTRDPKGHSYGEELETSECSSPHDWRDNAEYLWGVDLYNHGFLWEAHEAWEGLWHPAKRDPVLAGFFQGLIQCAAACLKIPMEQPAGLARLSTMGTQKLEEVEREVGEEFMGLELTGFTEAMRTFAASAPPSVEGRPRIVLATEK